MEKLAENDSRGREWKLTTVDPEEKSTWRSDARSALHAAARDPLMLMIPIHLHVYKICL